MWYIKYNDGSAFEVEYQDILTYEGQLLFNDELKSFPDDGIIINDANLLDYDVFEDFDDWPKVNAYRRNVGCSIEEAFDKWEEAYQGQYDDDAHFAESLADALGLVPTNVSWPLNCIDWEEAAKELMYDYFEEDGFYFTA